LISATEARRAASPPVRPLKSPVEVSMPRVQLALQLLEIDGRERVVERDDLDQRPAERPVEERVRTGADDADVLAGEVDRLVVLDGEVVVVDAPQSEAELSRGRRLLGGLLHVGQRGLRGGASSRLLATDLVLDDPLQTLGGGLDGALVDVAPDPAAPELLRDRGGGAGADEAVEDKVSQTRAIPDDAPNQLLVLFRRIILLVLVSVDVCP